MYTLLKEIFSTKHAVDLRNKFSKIYLNNTFRGDESRSGVGSNLHQTAVIRSELPKLIKILEIKTLIDAPCGDWYWMKETALGVEHYIGVDIVETLIEQNNQRFATAAQQFLCLNIAEDTLPRGDLIFCRDCLVHLNYADIRKVIANFKRSQSRYLLTTTFTARTKNIDLVRRNIWRTLNLQLAPFHFPPPLMIINENCTEMNGQYADKSLGLWLLDDLTVD